MPRLLDLLAPPSCLGCRAPGADLCGPCRRALPWLPDPRCHRCGLPGCQGRRRRCPAVGQTFAASWAPFAYAGPVPALVAGLKERRARVAGEPMVAAMARAPLWLLGVAPVLVPVPTARARARARGFDQARLLADGVADRHGPDATVSPCLERTGGPTRQRGATRGDRLAEGRIAIRAIPGVPVPELCVLVDDVHTTGATLDACARALIAAGAARVVALTCARTLR